MKWSDRLIDSLKKIKTKYVILMLDDFLINADVKQDKIDQCINWMDQNPDVAVFSFASSLWKDIDDALEWIIKIDESIPKNEKQKYAGVQGLLVHTDGKLIGRTFSGDKVVDCTTLEREKFNIYGDKAEVYYTNVISRYPFPEIEGEKFVTERLVWNKMAHDGWNG